MLNKKQIYKKYNKEQLNDEFIDACSQGHLEVVKYLLTSAELKKHADIHAKDDLGFRSACAQGHLDVVKYLLASPELTEHADIHTSNDDVFDGFDGFIWACENGHLEVVKYLLTSAELTEHADIHAKDDLGFLWACRCGHLEVIKYLIIDMNIEKTTQIENYLNEAKDNKYVQQAIELFNTRDLHHQLNENIKDYKEKVKKIKI